MTRTWCLAARALAFAALIGAALPLIVTDALSQPLGAGLTQGGGCVVVDLDEISANAVASGLQRCITRNGSKLRLVGDGDPYEVWVVEEPRYGCLVVNGKGLWVRPCEEGPANLWSLYRRGNSREIATPMPLWNDDGCLVIEDNMLTLVPCRQAQPQWD